MDSSPVNTVLRRPTLIEVLSARLRAKHYSLSTEKSYTFWVRRYIAFHGRRHPRELGAAEVTSFLTSLAVDDGVSAGTQNQALSALLFLYREVLEVELPWLDDVVRAKPSRRRPVVLTTEEVSRVLMHMEGTHALLAELLYGTGMRLMEGVRLRVKDVDFQRREILIRDGKGGKDRVTMLPLRLESRLSEQISRARRLHEQDREHRVPGVAMPDALG